MKNKIDVSMFDKRSAFGAAEDTAPLLQAQRTSRFKVLLAWLIVLLPLVWGLYATGQTVAPLIHTLLNSL